MERQSHGFAFENIIRNKYGIVKNPNYTGKWDGWLNGIPVSIKLEQFKTDVEMADFFRNANNTEDFYLIVGFWQGNKKNIVSYYTLFIPAREWAGLFNKECEKYFSYIIENITNDRGDDTKWKKWIKEGKEKWQSSTPNLIRPRFKRDHKAQKRIQCAINYQDFINYFVKKYGVILDDNN